MNMPAAANDEHTHRLHLRQVAARLREQYAELLKTAPPRRNTNAAVRYPAGASSGARHRAGRSLAVGPRRPPPVYRFTDPPLRRRDAPGHRRRTPPARLFVLLLVLHIVVIGAIVIKSSVESSLFSKVICGAVAVWIFFRALAALSRRITPPQRTTTRVTGRNCDRDIWL